MLKVRVERVTYDAAYPETASARPQAVTGYVGILEDASGREVWRGQRQDNAAYARADAETARDARRHD